VGGGKVAPLAGVLDRQGRRNALAVSAEEGIVRVQKISQPIPLDRKEGHLRLRDGMFEVGTIP